MDRITQVYTPPVKTIMIDQIYPRGWTMPKGYEATGEFRPPKTGEFFIASGFSAGDFYRASSNYSENDPRIILREKPKRKQVTFTETDEFRQPKDGEWFIAGFNVASIDYRQQKVNEYGNIYWSREYRIVTREEKEV